MQSSQQWLVLLKGREGLLFRRETSFEAPVTDSFCLRKYYVLQGPLIAFFFWTFLLLFWEFWKELSFRDSRKGVSACKSFVGIVWHLGTSSGPKGMQF